MRQPPFSSLCSPGNLTELGMVKGLLESADINFFVVNEEYAALGPVTGFADKAVTVVVRAEDLEEARELLRAQLGYRV